MSVVVGYHIYQDNLIVQGWMYNYYCGTCMILEAILVIKVVGSKVYCVGFYITVAAVSDL